jgi:hypothetical protein
VIIALINCHILFSSSSSSHALPLQNSLPFFYPICHPLLSFPHPLSPPLPFSHPLLFFSHPPSSYLTLSFPFLTLSFPFLTLPLRSSPSPPLSYPFLTLQESMRELLLKSTKTKDLNSFSSHSPGTTAASAPLSLECLLSSTVIFGGILKLTFHYYHGCRDFLF